MLTIDDLNTAARRLYARASARRYSTAELQVAIATLRDLALDAATEAQARHDLAEDGPAGDEAAALRDWARRYEVPAIGAGGAA